MKLPVAALLEALLFFTLDCLGVGRREESLDLTVAIMLSLDSALFLGFLTVATNASIDCGCWQSCGCGGGGLVKGRGSIGSDLLALIFDLDLSLVTLRAFFGNFFGRRRRGAEAVVGAAIVVAATVDSEARILEVEK
jgi:hypothetical protein